MNLQEFKTRHKKYDLELIETKKYKIEVHAESYEEAKFTAEMYAPNGDAIETTTSVNTISVEEVK